MQSNVTLTKHSQFRYVMCSSSSTPGATNAALICCCIRCAWEFWDCRSHKKLHFELNFGESWIWGYLKHLLCWAMSMTFVWFVHCKQLKVYILPINLICNGGWIIFVTTRFTFYKNQQKPQVRILICLKILNV